MDRRKVIRSTGLVGGFTGLSRMLGLVRDVFMAGAFGTGPAMSAFVVAFTVPNLFRRLFGEGALSSAFVPVFVKTREKEGDASAWVLARKMFTIVLFTLSVIALLGILIATGLLRIDGFSPHTELILHLLRIMLPYMVFICLVALCMGILNSFHHFAVPAATPCLLNLVMIASIVFLAPYFGAQPEQQIYGVAWGIFIAGFIQLGAQIPIMVRHGYVPGLSFDPKDRKVMKVMTLMVPAALGAAVTQVNVIVDRLLAFWIGPHAPAAMFFSERLIYLPLGIFATAMGTVLLPLIAGQVAKNEPQKIQGTINQSMRSLLFMMTPAAVGLLIMAPAIVGMIFQWKNFTAESTRYTAVALQFYAPGLIVFSLAKIFVPVFYAHQDTKTPMKVGLITVCLNLILNLTFVITWPYEIKHAGLAFATVLSETFHAIVLGVIIHKRFGNPGWWEILRAGLRFALGAGLMGVTIYLAYDPILTRMSSLLSVAKVPEFAAVMITIGLGAFVYGVSAYVLRFPELREVTSLLRRRK
ncbi:MAG: putative peptidoglycan lipid II flippase [Candidatus Omnitrophota bacterium]|jgi:putative peptidoglycan lipid II flippase